MAARKKQSRSKPAQPPTVQSLGDAFGARLAEYRQRAALTQRQLAERVGVSRRQIAYYESGNSRPPGALLGLLADFFEVSTDVLLGREVPRAPAGRLSRVLLVRLRQVEELGTDAARRLERMLDRFVDEEQSRTAPERRRKRAPPARSRATRRPASSGRRERG